MNIPPVQEENNIKTHDVMCKLVSTKEFCRSYSEQIGKIPITSSRGHKYIFVFYHYNTSTITGWAINSHNPADICEAWQAANDELKAHGEAPNIHILDNEY